MLAASEAYMIEIGSMNFCLRLTNLLSATIRKQATLAVSSRPANRRLRRTVSQEIGWPSRRQRNVAHRDVAVEQISSIATGVLRDWPDNSS
jgi:hypothetical protein